ncbi:MAG: hypothetical protein MJ137_08770 [Clostridia bacterium]|nr:hypothetical protein [Clostridia bacterium]
MKKIIVVLLSAIMVMSAFASLNVSAEESGKLPIIGVFYYSADKTQTEKTATLIDGVIGDNKSAKADWGWGDQSCWVKYPADTVIPYKEKVTASSLSYDEGFKPASQINESDLKLVDGTTYKYWYSVEIMLDNPSTVESLKMYFHGYKPGVLDMNFSIFVSSDAENWKLVKEAGTLNPLVGEDGLLTAEGVAEYQGAVNVVGGTAGEDPCAFLEWNATVPEENVQFIRYCTNRSRYNNAYYTMRFTEIEVIGVENEIVTTEAATTAGVTTAEATTAEATTAEATTAEATTAGAVTAEVTTGAPAADVTTAAPAGKGCGSSVSAFALSAIISLGALVIRKKRG